MQEITLNVPAARRWLAEQAKAVEDGEDYDIDIGATWKPTNEDQGHTCVSLVHLVQTEAEGVIEGLEGRSIDLIFSDDMVGGTYLFSLRLPSRYPGGAAVKLADPVRCDMIDIGARDSCGPDAAVAIVQEAVNVANRLSSDLVEYTRSFVLVVRDPDCQNDYTVDGNVATVDIDLGYAFDSTPNDEQEALNFVADLGAKLDPIAAQSHALGAALDTYANAVEDYPNASAVVEAYRITRQRSPRLMWALRLMWQAHPGDASAVARGVCSTCLNGEAEIEELVIAAEAEENGYDESGQLHDATELPIDCIICGYKHRPAPTAREQG